MKLPVEGSYISALLSEGGKLLTPAVISTLPFGSNVAVWFDLPVAMLLAAVKIPVAGSYISELDWGYPEPFPPATKTCPFGKSVAVCKYLEVPMLPVAVKLPVAGS